MRELYAVLKDQAMFTAYEQFETFQIDSGMNITEYINQFEQLNHKLKTYKIDLPKSKRDLVRVTIAELKYDDMKRQIKAIYDSCTTADEKVASDGDIEVENENAYYSCNNKFSSNRGWNFRGGCYRGRGGVTNRGFCQEENRASQDQSSTCLKNFPDENGNPTHCKVCGSIFHFTVVIVQMQIKMTHL